MKKKILFNLLCFVGVCSACFGQSKDFISVYHACQKAQSSMSDNKGSKNDIQDALRLLKEAEWSSLILQDDDVKGEADMKGHMVFSPSFFAELNKGDRVYKKAREYAKEMVVSKRGGKVYLCTKCLGAGKKVTYKMNHTAKSLRVAAVPEVNGLINLSVVIQDSKGKKSMPYKITSQEFQGASCRLLDPIQMPSGRCVVYITIENKFHEPKSVDIIVE